MTFKELTDQDKEYITVIYTSTGLSHQEKIDILSKKYEVAGRSIRRWASRMGISSDNKKMPKQLQAARNRVLPEDTDIILVTSAQNKTSINLPFFDNLRQYQRFLQTMYGCTVRIVIIPSRYRNPTSRIAQDNYKSEEWWVDEIDEYLYYNKIQFGDTLISADSRVVPTASNPLSGYEALASEHHLVLGHPRIHYKTLPRFKGDKLRVMCTTGFITSKNYSVSKAGEKGYVHHSYGFTVVEKKKDGTCYIPRTVKVNSDGSFCDLIYHVKDSKVEEISECEAAILGDIHYQVIDNAKMDATHNILSMIKPKDLILHDVFDGHSVNPHDAKDMYFQRQKIVKGEHIIEKELDSTIEFVKNLAQDYEGSNIKIIQSNHDDFLDRYVNNHDWKKDLHNSTTYLKLAQIQQSEDLTHYGNIFGHIVSNSSDTVEYIPNNRGHMVLDYQVGHHGDHGVNGARGSVVSFKRLNKKMIHGHGHSPRIEDGVTMVGVSCLLWQYYNSKGLSSWAHADCIVHSSGKNQLIVYDENYEVSGFFK